LEVYFMQKKMILGGLGATLILASLLGKAEAKPPFAAKEGLKCTYCHVGPPKRNYRGDYYKMHNLTFAGFDDAAEAKKAGVDVGADADSKPKSLTPPAGGGKPVGAPPKPAGESAATKQAKIKLAAAEANLKAKPKDAKCVKAAADAHTALGKAVMNDAGLMPKEKYPWAQKEFGAALALNPKDAEAAKFKKAIDDVYAGMKK
jgi:hypothetical protein